MALPDTRLTRGSVCRNADSASGLMRRTPWYCSSAMTSGVDADGERQHHAGGGQRQHIGEHERRRCRRCRARCLRRSRCRPVSPTAGQRCTKDSRREGDEERAHRVFERRSEVPEISASQPASGISAMPISPLTRRVGAKREAQERVRGSAELGSGDCGHAISFLSGWICDRCRSRRRNLLRRRLRTSHVGVTPVGAPRGTARRRRPT